MLTQERSRRRMYEMNDKPEGILEPEVLPPLMREPLPSAEWPGVGETIQSLRLKKANIIVAKHTFSASFAGILPLGIGTSLICGAIQIRMIRELCNCYKVKFSKHSGTTALSVILGVVASSALVNFAGRAAMVLVPGWSGLLTMATSVAAANGTTYLIGRIFVFHFELGGSLFDLDVDKARKIVNELKTNGEIA